MASKFIDDIIGLAQRESAHAGHYYVGVEHLFIALSRLEGGVTVSTLEEQGVSPRFVRYIIRQELGQGDERRFWPGFRETPRLQAVIQLARQLAEERGHAEPTERDLLVAILREGDSLPYRVLRNMEVDLDRLEVMAANWSATRRLELVRVAIVVEVPGLHLAPPEEEVLQQMFRGCEKVVIDQVLHGGYSSARVLVARPHQADGRALAAVVVKLDDRQAILYEKLRYDSYVRDTLPPASARMLDNPVAPEKCPLGGLKYTFIRERDTPGPVDLADFGREHGPEALADLLRNSLFRAFGETWWSQRHLYQFGVWQEYEMVLPPALVLDAAPDVQAASRRLTPYGQWSRRGRFGQGEVVVLEGFSVEDFYPDRQGIQLVGGSGPEAQNRAMKVEVRGLPAAGRRYYRGAVVDKIVGRVRFTRDDLLREEVLLLEPEFSVDLDWLPEHPLFPYSLPNPIRRYRNLLQRRISGSLSTIHGDLHMHNILLGPGGEAWLIDFAQAREGHTLFDWAVLETSLLAEFVEASLPDEGWDSIWAVVAGLLEVGRTRQAPRGDHSVVGRALTVIAALRQIVGECLADPDDWREYYIALALTAMRGLRWTHTVSLKGRRLLYLVAALAMSLATGRDGPAALGPDMDTTDGNLDLTDAISDQQLRDGLRQADPDDSGAVQPDSDQQSP